MALDSDFYTPQNHRRVSGESVSITQSIHVCSVAASQAAWNRMGTPVVPPAPGLAWEVHPWRRVGMEADHRVGTHLGNLQKDTKRTSVFYVCSTLGWWVGTCFFFHVSFEKK